jgi:HEPN domain-containing protein
MAQAERDLEVASTLRERGMHEWACFAAQQAAEKALKAALYSYLRESRTHVLKDLVRDLDNDAPGMLLDRARVLDGYYISTRYADGHESGAPFSHYGELQSEQAIEYAGILIEFARSRMARSR